MTEEELFYCDLGNQVKLLRRREELSKQTPDDMCDAVIRAETAMGHLIDAYLFWKRTAVFLIVVLVGVFACVLYEYNSL